MDISNTIAAISDQLNADDLIGKTKTIKITKVSAATTDQPVKVNFEGDDNKPYYPCKSMRRVMVQIWGANGASYIGKSLTLYRDDKVKFGGIEVGGIRISHMEGLDKPKTMALTATRANKKPFTVKPLIIAAPEPEIDLEAIKSDLKAAAIDMETFGNAWKSIGAKAQNLLIEYKDELKAQIEANNSSDNEDDEIPV